MLTAVEQRVCRDIAQRESDLLADLRLHVGLPTGGGNRSALDESRERLTTRAAALGAAVEFVPGAPRPAWLYLRDEDEAALPTAVCRRLGSNSAGREFLISGHLDTVHDPAGPFRELTVEPDGKKGIGPGVVDMKGGLVIALAALEAIHSVGEALNWTLMLNADEETGSFSSARAIADEAAQAASRGGLGIALEPAAAGGALVVERAGSGQFMIEARGRAAHVGRDFASGVSAVTALAHVIATLAQASRPAEGLIVNVGPLQGGTATNVVPDLARAWGNVRVSSVEQQREFEQVLRHACETGRLPGSTVVSQCVFSRPCKPCTPEVTRFAEHCRSCAASLGQKLPFTRTSGVCDGNNMQAAGLTTLDTLGVRGGGLHTPEEWIELPSLVERCQLLAVVMLRGRWVPAATG